MKNLRILLAIAMIFCLTACGVDTSSNATNPTSGTVPNVTTSATSTEVPTEEATEKPTEEPTEEPTVPLETVEEPNMTNNHYVLTEVATFTNADIRSFSSHMPVVRTTVDGQIIDYLYSYTGEILINDGCTDYDYFGEGRTAMCCTDQTRFVNVFTGEVYLEGADIQRVIQMNDRYYFVVFADHGQVYDLERGRYIDGLKVTDLTLSMVPRAVNDTVFEKLDYGHYRVYLGDGSVFGEITDAKFTETGYICETNSGFEVYDSNCTKISTVQASFASLEYATDVSNTYCWRYFKGGEFETYTVMDINGNTVIPGTYSSVQNYGDYVIVEDAAAGKGLYLTDGTLILDMKYSDILYRMDLGVFQLTTDSGDKQVYIPGCGIWDLGELSVSGKLIKDYSYNYMILSTGEVLHLEKARELLGTSMVNCSLGVVDTNNGNVVLEPGYDSVVATQEYIYEYRDGVWHVYSYELVKE